MTSLFLLGYLNKFFLPYFVKLFSHHCPSLKRASDSPMVNSEVNDIHLFNVKKNLSEILIVSINKRSRYMVHPCFIYIHIYLL